MLFEKIWVYFVFAMCFGFLVIVDLLVNLLEDNKYVLAFALGWLFVILNITRVALIVDHFKPYYIIITVIVIMSCIIFVVDHKIDDTSNTHETQNNREDDESNIESDNKIQYKLSVDHLHRLVHISGEHSNSNKNADNLESQIQKRSSEEKTVHIHYRHINEELSMIFSLKMDLSSPFDLMVLLFFVPFLITSLIYIYYSKSLIFWYGKTNSDLLQEVDSKSHSTQKAISHNEHSQNCKTVLYYLKNYKILEANNLDIGSESEIYKKTQKVINKKRITTKLDESNLKKIDLVLESNSSKRNNGLFKLYDSLSTHIETKRKFRIYHLTLNILGQKIYDFFVEKITMDFIPPKSDNSIEQQQQNSNLEDKFLQKKIVDVIIYSDDEQTINDRYNETQNVDILSHNNFMFDYENEQSFFDTFKHTRLYDFLRNSSNFASVWSFYPKYKNIFFDQTETQGVKNSINSLVLLFYIFGDVSKVQNILTTHFGNDNSYEINQRQVKYSKNDEHPINNEGLLSWNMRSFMLFYITLFFIPLLVFALVSPISVVPLDLRHPILSVGITIRLLIIYLIWIFSIINFQLRETNKISILATEFFKCQYNILKIYSSEIQNEILDATNIFVSCISKEKLATTNIRNEHDLNTSSNDFLNIYKTVINRFLVLKMNSDSYNKNIKKKNNTNNVFIDTITRTDINLSTKLKHKLRDNIIKFMKQHYSGYFDYFNNYSTTEFALYLPIYIVVLCLPTLSYVLILFVLLLFFFVSTIYHESTLWKVFKTDLNNIVDKYIFSSQGEEETVNNLKHLMLTLNKNQPNQYKKINDEPLPPKSKYIYDTYDDTDNDKLKYQKKTHKKKSKRTIRDHDRNNNRQNFDDFQTFDNNQHDDNYTESVESSKTLDENVQDEYEIHTQGVFG